MRTGRTTAPGTTAAPEDRRPLRAVAGLVLFFIVSSGPVAAASPTADPEVAAPTGATGDVVTSADRSRAAGPWSRELRNAVPETPATVTNADDGGEGARSAQISVAQLQRQHAPKRFRMNLFRNGDFVSQKTSFWCIPASTQMMMNMIDHGQPNRSRAMQQRLYRIGDRLEEDGTFSRDPEPDRWRGMGISEWVGLLNRYGHGPYEVAGARSLPKALKQAARMMRKTGKPVGLVVWHGAHAWVMSGFVATADPAVTNDFEVIKVWVQDPWYPRTSSIWGRSRGPNAKISPRVLGQDFKRYGRPGRPNPERDGRYMLVLPRAERAEAGAAA
jgi:hypothetical protein